MADSEVRQKFEARVLETIKYAKREDFVIGESRYNNPNLQEWFGWFAAGMRAGEIARWIPVEEKPDVSGEYLTCIDDGHHKPSVMSNVWDAYSNSWRYASHVTHWQPLPAAPEEKKP